MAYNVDVYKGVIKLGSGSMTNGSFTLSSYTATTAGNSPAGKNVTITATSGNNIGATTQNRVVTDGVTSLTLFHSGKFT